MNNDQTNNDQMFNFKLPKELEGLRPQAKLLYQIHGHFIVVSENIGVEGAASAASFGLVFSMSKPDLAITTNLPKEVQLGILEEAIHLHLAGKLGIGFSSTSGFTVTTIQIDHTAIHLHVSDTDNNAYAIMQKELFSAPPPQSDIVKH